MKLQRVSIILLLPFFGVSSLIGFEGEDPLSEEAPVAAVVPVEKPERYELKNRSSFGIAKNARAPFWPIGWVKPKAGIVKPVVARNEPVVAEVDNRFLIEARHFNVTSVLTGNPPLATINGRSFGEGEVLPVVAGNARIRVVVRSIRDGGVALQQDEHVVFVPLQRPKYSPREPAAQTEPQGFTIKIE